MIAFHTGPTPNGHRAAVALEETGVPYTVHRLNLAQGDQRRPEYLAINPAGAIPAIVDPDGPDGQPISMFESGAILVYLASKVNKFLGQTDREKFTVLQWLMFQMGGLGPMLGQAHHFRIYAPEQIEYAVNRYTNEAKRLYGVMDKQLANHRYIAGDEYTIADIACFPWTRSWKNQGIDWADFPDAKRWHDEIAARPAVQRGVQVLADLRKPLLDEKSKEMLFGAAQYQKR